MGKDKVVVVKTSGDQKAVSLMNMFEGSALLEEGDKVRNSHWSGLIAASSPLLLKQNKKRLFKVFSRRLLNRLVSFHIKSKPLDGYVDFKNQNSGNLRKDDTRSDHV